MESSCASSAACTVWRTPGRTILAAQLRFPKGTFSDGTALFLHGYTDRTPLQLTMTFPRSYRATKARGAGIEVRICADEVLDLGRTSVKTSYGNKVRAYDLERTLCDVVRSQRIVDVQVVNPAMRQYARSSKDVQRLLGYAHALRSEEEDPKLSGGAAVSTKNAMQLKAIIRNGAKAEGVLSQLVMQSYLLERLLERISLSTWRDYIVIKDGVLISSLVGVGKRGTKDLDTTVRDFPLTHENVEKTFREIADVKADDDFSLSSSCASRTYARPTTTLASGSTCWRTTRR